MERLAQQTKLAMLVPDDSLEVSSKEIYANQLQGEKDRMVTRNVGYVLKSSENEMRKVKHIFQTKMNRWESFERGYLGLDFTDEPIQSISINICM